MPTYDYIALKSGGKEEVRGRIEADTERDARVRIRARGETPVEGSIRSIRVHGAGFLSLSSLFRYRGLQKEVLLFSTQLSTLIRSGITLTDALKVLGEQNTNRQFSNVINLVCQSLKERGSTFAQALSGFPQCFSPLYVSMVKAGESTGTLPDVLDRLALYAKKRAALETKIRSALTYPAIMCVMGFLVVTFLLSYLVPKIVPLLEQQHKALPLSTEILILVSNAVKAYWILGLLAVIGAALLFKWFASTKRGRRAVDKLALNMPVFGELRRKGAVSRFCLTLSSLLKTGVKIEEALRIVKDVVGNVIVAEAVGAMSEKIKEGHSIAAPLAKTNVFPRMVVFMISVGEKAGSEELQEMLDNIAEAYDTEVEQSADRLTAMLNPILLIVLAGLVCFILFSILLPIMQLNSLQKLG